MAELLGIVAGGAGLASLALQLVDGGQKLRHRYKNAKGMEGNVLWLSEDIELIGKQLIQLEASADDIMQEQLGPIMMGRCRDRSAKVADRLANLAGDLPLASNGSEFKDFDLMEEPEILANLIQLFVRSFRTKETTHSVSLLKRMQNVMRYNGHMHFAISLSTLGCDFKNVVPTWEAQPLTHIFQPHPFDFRFMKLFLKTNPDFGDSPPLHASILFDSDVNFKLCLERVAQPFEKIVNFLGQSALHKGVCQPSRVAQLLAAGHPVDLSDKNGITPLMYAASMNVPETVMMLVENGAKLFITGENDFTVLNLVAMRGNWDLIWQIVDFAAASYPRLVPELFGSLLPHLVSDDAERCYAAHDSSGLKGCIKFWSRVISTLGSPNFYFNDGTTLMHMTDDSRSARALIELGFSEFKQEDGALLEHLGSLHDLSLFRFAVANGGDEHLHNDWGWDILSAVLDGLTTHSRKDLPEVLGILQFLLDRGVQVLSRDGCVCNCSAGGCMPGLCSLPIESNLRLFAWLEILEKKRNVEEAKEFLLALLRQMCFDQADTDNDRFWDIPEQISIEESNQEMEVLAAKAYSELKIEVMVRLRRIWRKEYAGKWPGPRLAPRFRRNVQNNSERSLNGLLEEIRTSKQPKIPEPLSSSWECIVQKKLKSNHLMLRFDLELAVVEFGVDLYRCGGDQFESWLPLLSQLTDVLLAEEPGASES
ncbi:hypothetical protein FOPG_06858 [Fusarium oxysporum f. sp. conglutinans race 2 54008]|uniref:Uncharacterized protein n=1 Tax=Fusarium oxysporum f. sp. conglutinans race 2 54008 TaxID=1089457 RepID=X0HRH7_FUSOX|nr:hypothetical protein FOPG_06858 [Fusarium oxysporum f. sp. conglutinans race 2 54008]